ncbi:MAG TPA: hypothetical protein VHO01_02830 [Jatrophihabitans sp.]|nr:hypothetical protein [Jatrophihabitans sp.]
MPAPQPPSSPRQRLERLQQLKVRTGLLPVAEQAALAGVGFEPVTEVIGALAKQVQPTGFYSAGNYWQDRRGRTYTSSTAPVSVGKPLRIKELKEGNRTVLARIRAEAQAAGADGVVGLQLSLTREGRSGGTELWRFLAVGTAVRSTGRRRAATPFTTDLSGTDVASAVRAGWVPLSMVIAPVMAIRLVDPWSQGARRRWAPPGEIAAYADVVGVCRRQARDDFAAEAERAGGDAAVLSRMELDFDPNRNEGYCEAMVTVTGTALGQFRAPAREAGLPIMRLSSKGEQ